jgi:hypothetical protein
VATTRGAHLSVSPRTPLRGFSRTSMTEGLRIAFVPARPDLRGQANETRIRSTRARSPATPSRNAPPAVPGPGATRVRPR